MDALRRRGRLPRGSNYHHRGTVPSPRRRSTQPCQQCTGRSGASIHALQLLAQQRRGRAASQVEGTAPQQSLRLVQAIRSLGSIATSGSGPPICTIRFARYVPSPYEEQWLRNVHKWGSSEVRRCELAVSPFHRSLHAHHPTLARCTHDRPAKTKPFRPLCTDFVAYRSSHLCRASTAALSAARVCRSANGSSTARISCSRTRPAPRPTAGTQVGAMRRVGNCGSGDGFHATPLGLRGAFPRSWSTASLLLCSAQPLCLRGDVQWPGRGPSGAEA